MAGRQKIAAAANTESQDAELVRRALPIMWLGASVIFLVALLTHGVNGSNSFALFIIDLCGWAMFASLSLERGRLPAWYEEFSQYAAIALITTIVAVDRDPASAFALFYLWLAVQASYVAPWKRAIVQWAVMAIGYAVALTISVGDGFPFVRWVMMVATAFVIGALVAYLRQRNLALVARLNDAADTDALTELGNRRRLIPDLERALEAATPAHPAVLAMFDLDGFKAYNDLFGHPAGDALLRRLGRTLGEAVTPAATAYRLGGDEFCVLGSVSPLEAEELVEVAERSLVETGKGFEIGASSGHVMLPDEAQTAPEALRIADSRMYLAKGKRASAGERLSRELLLRVLDARQPALPGHYRSAGQTAAALGRVIGMSPEDLDVLMRAAELHDIGKMGIPESVLMKPGPLDEVEMALIRTHPLIGERILDATPAMSPVARLVRSSHEHWDGGGYPDGKAGEEIPLGARAILICDAFEAMTTEHASRPARSTEAALGELQRNAGTQFDPVLVMRFCELVESGELAESVLAAAG